MYRMRHSELCGKKENLQKSNSGRIGDAKLFANVKNLMEKIGWSAEQSMDVLSVSDGDRKEL